jgi:hypothetical protein
VKLSEAEMAYELRAATAGAILAQHLRFCIYAEAKGIAYPDPDDIGFDSPDDVEAGIRLMCALAGIADPTPDALAKMLRLFTALAEVIGDQGAELEAAMFNLISPDGFKTATKAFRAKVDRGRDAAE